VKKNRGDFLSFIEWPLRLLKYLYFLYFFELYLRKLGLCRGHSKDPIVGKGLDMMDPFVRRLAGGSRERGWLRTMSNSGVVVTAEAE
jgi:hypothetical protein